MNKQNDIAFGKKMEDDALPKLSCFGEVVKIDDQYFPFDFKTNNNKLFIELKSRNNAKNTYPTTMVGQSKVDIAKTYPKKKFIFCFNFTDGLYYIPYEKELFDTFEIKHMGRHDRGRAELNNYCLIPVDKLIALG
jgi:hypothetical protein